MTVLKSLSIMFALILLLFGCNIGEREIIKDSESPPGEKVKIETPANNNEREGKNNPK